MAQEKFYIGETIQLLPKRVGDPISDKASLNDYFAPANMQPAATDTADVPVQYQPVWVNKQNKILMDSKPVPAARSDRMLPASKKITAKKVQQTDLIAIAGNMLGQERAAGITPPTDYFALYQIYHETDGFTSPLFTLHYNGAGIKFSNQPGATKQPTGLPYAWFTNWPDFMASFKHELTKGSNPANATTLADFAHRLKMNGYYEDSESNYLAGLIRAQKALSGFTTGANINAEFQKPLSGLSLWWHNLSLIQKTEWVAGGVAGLFIIKALNR